MVAYWSYVVFDDSGYLKVTFCLLFEAPQLLYRPPLLSQLLLAWRDILFPAADCSLHSLHSGCDPTPSLSRPSVRAVWQSAHHRLQTAADTHSTAALIKKSAASKVSQSKSGVLRSSSRFSGEAAVLIFPEPRRRVEGWGRQIRRGQSCIWLSDGGRSGLEMCRLRWACDTAGTISLWWFNCCHTLIYFNYRSM